MGDAIGQMLPAAVGVAISPVPIIAVVLMLVSRRGRANGPAFVVGWVLGLAVLGGVLLAPALFATASDGGEPKTWVGVVKILLGALLLLVALREWRGRPRGDAEPATPKWMGALDSFTPVKALGAGALLSSVNPKNTLLVAAGAAAIAGAGLSTGSEVVAYALFVVIATIGVAAPIVISIVLGDRSAEVLDDLKRWMAANNAVIMAVLLLVLGVKMVGDGIGAL